MPDLQDIEKFKQILNPMGGEEEIEDVEPPGEGLSAELKELLEPGGEAAVEDFGLADLTIPAEEPAEPAPAGEEISVPPPAAEEPTEELDFAALFGEAAGGEPTAEAGAEGADLMEALEAALPPAEEAAEEPAAPGEAPEPAEAAEPSEAVEAPPEEEDFLLSEMLLPEEEAGEQPPAFEAPAEGPPAAEVSAEVSAEAPEEIPAEVSAEEEFELPEFLDLSEAEEALPVAEAAGEEAETFDLSALLGEEEAPAEAPPTPPAEEVPAEEEFELPESLDLIAEEEALPAVEAGPPVEPEPGAEAFPEAEAVSAEELGKLMEELEAGEPAAAAAPEGAMAPEAPAEPEGPAEALEFPDIEGLEEIDFGELGEAAEPAEEEAIAMEGIPPEGEEEPTAVEPAAMEGIPPVGEEELAAMEALAEPAEAEALEMPGEAPPPVEEELPAEFDLGEGLEEEVPAAEPAPPSAEGLEALEAGEEEEYEFDEFSLQGLAEDFGVGEEAAAEAPPGEAPAGAGPGEAVAEAPVPPPTAEAELELSDQQFSRLKQSLGYLPRNLKIAIEELIGEQNLGGDQLKKLVDLLVRGAAPAAVAAQVSAITGRRITLPRRFEKKTGLAYEEERGRFAYRFRENILPILRVFVFSLVVLGLFAFLGYRYVYRPLYANTLYRRGYRQIEKERYVLANQDFERAARLQQFRHWYSRYAEAFIEQKQFILADQKYDALLERWPGDRKGSLGWADLESVYMENYEHADELLSALLAEDIKDDEALLAQGDNFLRWAEEDPNRYEDARFAYASIIDYYGMRDPVLMRMMRYFIRTDNLKEVRDLKAMLEAKEKLKVEPELYADVYAELGGYLFDRGVTEDLPDPLFKAMDARPEHPEVHYQLARYFKYIGNLREEEKALNEAIRLLGGSPLTRRQRAQLIDCYNRLGHLNWRRREYLAAETNYLQAQAMIEEAQARGIFGPNEDFGAVYKNLGDIYYYREGNLETAARLYRTAEKNLLIDVDLDFKLGYISYVEGDYDEALLRFSRVVDQRPRDENALLSLANSLYERSDYFSAQGYYLHLLDVLETRKNNIPYLRIQDNPEHRSLIEYLLLAHNNLGVTLKKLADRAGDPDKDAQALVNLTFSSEYFDMISRDPETLKRGLTRNLAYLNQRGILYPESGFSLQIYNRLPVDLESRNF